jgi:hypothetical protein
MDFEVLPGPSLPEVARTALARAPAATVGDAGSRGGLAAMGPVPVRAGPDGNPLLLAATGSPLEQWLTAGREAVTVSVPADAPFSALRLTGTVRLTAPDRAAGITACTVTVRSVELAGPAPTWLPLRQYRAAAADPLWREAPAVLRHLEHGHMADLVGCVRAHGMPEADWIIPQGLDRYGLELLVLTPGGVAAVRLSFPDGPVTSLQDVPASIRTALTCRCRPVPDDRNGRATSA